MVELDYLPDFRRWAVLNPKMTLSEYARATVSVDHFFAVASILWPKFVRHGEGLFLADGFSPERFETWMASCNDDITRVERVMNHRHIGDLLGAFAQSNEGHLFDSAAELLQRCWTAKIRSAFPSVSANVVIYRTDSDVELTIFTARG